MPELAITNSGGDTPRLAANASRTIIVLQNNSAQDIRFRLFGPVSLSDPTKKGLLIRAGGGFFAITGEQAKLALYAIHAAAGQTIPLDYEAD